MGNFAVNASEDVISQGKKLLEEYAEPGEKQGDVLARIFRIAAEKRDGETLKQGGVDVQALDASLSNIRSMFLSAVGGKEQIIADKDSKIDEIKKLKDQMEADLREKLITIKTERDQAVSATEEAITKVEQAGKEANDARGQLNTLENLVAEKEKTIATLAEKLALAESKAKGYDDLKQENESLKRQISDNAKDAALAQEKAIRKVEIENAKLQAKIDLLEAQKNPA